jgi:hypothetical protein
MAHLYVATRSDRADIVKIGRSSGPGGRCGQLQCSQAFYVRPAAVFQDAGRLEGEVHRRLQHRRLQACPGREWFSALLWEALLAVAAAMPAPQPAARGLGCGMCVQFLPLAPGGVSLRASAVGVAARAWRGVLAFLRFICVSVLAFCLKIVLRFWIGGLKVRMFGRWRCRGVPAASATC